MNCFRPLAVLFLLLACAATMDETLSGITTSMDALTGKDDLPAQDPARS